VQIQVPFAGPQLPDDYGDHIPNTQKVHGINQRSFPFQVTDIPRGAIVLAGSLVVYDTVSFVGFPWLHWVFTDLPVTGATVTVPADASRHATFPQGLNSLHSPFQRTRQLDWILLKDHDSLETHYAGPRPVGGVHTYRLTIYALTAPTHLRDGFLEGDLMNQLDSQLIATTGRNFTYQKKI